MDDDQKDQRNDQDNENQTDDNNNNQNGSSSIGKYFGKADKNIKLLTTKFKSWFKFPKTQKKVYYTIESSTKQIQYKKDLYEKAKIKYQYASYIERLNGKLKIKLAVSPLDSKYKFSELSFNLKQLNNKNIQTIYDIKLNNQLQLILKLKRIQYFMNKSIKNQADGQISVNKNRAPRLTFNFDSLQKIDFQTQYQYVKSTHLKGKFTIKTNQTGLNLVKFQFLNKLFTQFKKFKLKTQGKFILNWSAKGYNQLKGSLQLSDKSKLWTVYSSISGYIFGVKHDQSKCLYSLTQNWKIGASYNSKGPQFIIHNGKMNFSWMNSFGLYSSLKNMTMIIKNKLDRNSLGKTNYEISLQVKHLLNQSKILPKSINDLTIGFMFNINR